MIIEGEDFRLTPINEYTTMYDLELLFTVKPRGKEERQEFQNAGYGLPLDHAIHKIIQYRVNKKNSDIITLETFIKSWKEESNKIYEIFKSFK